MKLKATICLLVAILLTATVTIAEPELVTEEAMCTTVNAPSIGEISRLIWYITNFEPLGLDAYQFDYVTDGIIDKKDWVYYNDCSWIPECDFNAIFPLTTVCNPAVIWSWDTTNTRGSAVIAFVGGTATVTGVGPSGDDGVRIWPNMEQNWKSGVRAELDNIVLGGELSEGAKFAFTGVKSGYEMDWLAWVEAGHVGGVISLTLGLKHLTEPTIDFRGFDCGDETVSTMIASSELTLSGNPINGTPTITAVSMVYTSSTTLAIEFDRAIEFTIEGEASPAFMADLLMLRSENAYQTALGLGPFDVTGTDLGSFTVSFEEIDALYLPCVGRVGDANGLGGDEPTIGDVSAMIDFLFLSELPDAVMSLTEADLNQSGGCDPIRDDITISDVSILIDYLFITGPELGLPDCLDCP